MVMENLLKQQFCKIVWLHKNENISKTQYKKDMRKSYTYTATINTVEIDINTQYYIKDAQLGIDGAK